MSCGLDGVECGGEEELDELRGVGRGECGLLGETVPADEGVGV